MKDYAGTLLLVALTTMIGIGCYGVTAHGAGQRNEIESMQRKIAADGRAIRDLEMELRTRARMPLIERWNQDVLKMSAPRAGQFMRSPMQLVSMMTPETDADRRTLAPTVRLALAPAMPVAQPGLVQASVAVSDAPAVVLRTAYPADER